MTKQIIAAFDVAGFSSRTNNAAETTAQGKIPLIWGQFMQSGMMQSLADRIGDEIYAVYTAYAGDHTGDYTFVVGCKVSSTKNLPEGVAVAHVPAGNYAVLTSEKGPTMQVVPALWQKIWSLTPAELQGKRAFKTDFELYDDRARNPKSAQVDIFLGLLTE